MSSEQPPNEYFCPECGYDLRSLSEPRCPECGFRFDWQALRTLNAEWVDARQFDLRAACVFQAVTCVAVLIFRVASFGRITLTYFLLYEGFIGVVPIVLWLILSGNLGTLLRGDPTPGWVDKDMHALRRHIALAVVAGVVLRVTAPSLFWVIWPASAAAFGLSVRRDFQGGCFRLDAPSVDAATRRGLQRWSMANNVLVVLSAAAVLAAVWNWGK